MEKEDLLEKFSEFLREFCYNDLSTAMTEGRKSISVDFSLLDKHYGEIAEYILESPNTVMPLLDEAVKQIDVGGEMKLKVRFFNLPESREIRIRNIRAEHIGKLISVDGIVKRASEIRPEVSEAIFQCPECGNRIEIIQSERMINAPIECECGNRRGFKLIDQKLFDARWIAFEEPYEIVSGERPSELMVYLKEDLTSPNMQNKTDPGNRIKVVGVLRELARRIKGTRSRQMEIFIDANSVESKEIEWEELDITAENVKKFLELANDPQIYDKLVASVAPTLFGLEEVKEAIILQMFSGEPHVQKDKSRVRGDIHILLVGDPSTAKSAIMKVASMLIPRGRYVSGKGVTAAGLTASVIRDEEFLGGWVLEAGALVLCNRSVCAIDEFEKVEKTDQIALHEAMEQQTISIAKANIVASLPARTAVLAGGNPKFGRFDPYMPIKEQIDIPETLLSRFDIKFALRDVPNPELDVKIADHILKSRHFEGEEVLPVIDADSLKKFVAYARKNCHPKLTREAGKMLKDFYVKMREKTTTEEAPVPITLRQYESLIRMAEASAKIQLKNEVGVEDAIRAINLMKASLRQFGFDPETGKIDIDRAEGHTTASQRSRIRIVLDVIDELGKIFGRDVPMEEVVRKGRELRVENIEDILRGLQAEGVIFSPRPGFIQKV